MKPKVFQGGLFEDQRGILQFNNNLSFFNFKRFYIITSPSNQMVRAWQGHKYEGKLFTVLNGSFIFKLVIPDNWEYPSKDIDYEQFELTDDGNQSLYVPGGYFIGFMNKDKNSRLLVHSDVELKDSISDDYRLDSGYWKIW